MNNIMIIFTPQPIPNRLHFSKSIIKKSPNIVPKILTKQCDECVKNYLFISGECKEIKAVGCFEYDDENNCKSCPLKFGLKPDTVNSLTNCEPISILNCLVSKTIFPFQCDVCSRGYYVETDNTCKKAPVQISNCSVYDVSG